MILVHSLIFSKIGRIIRSQSDVKDLQRDLGRLNEWVVRWQNLMLIKVKWEHTL